MARDAEPQSMRARSRSRSRGRSGPMIMYLHRNGELVLPGRGLSLKINPAQLRNMDQLLDEVTTKVRRPLPCPRLRVSAARHFADRFVAVKTSAALIEYE